MGGYFMALGTFGVPVFFLVAGYFSHDKIGRVFVFTKTKKLIKYLIVGLGLCFVWDLLGRNFDSIDFGMENIISFIAFNATEFFSKSFYLWFLPALIYCYVAFGLCEKLSTILIKITPILLVLLMVLQVAYAHNVFGNKYYLYRNWIFAGIPFFAIGRWSFAKKSLLFKHYKTFLLVGIISLLGIAVERYIWQVFTGFYVSAIITAVTMFFWAISTENTVVKDLRLSRWISELPLIIYMLHVFVTALISKTLPMYLDFPGAYSLLVFFLSSMIGIILLKMRDYYGIKINAMRNNSQP